MIPEGTTAIRNLQTGAIVPTPLGQCRPSECDLREHEELVAWTDGKWLRLEDTEPTETEAIIMDIRAFVGAIEDRLDELERLI